jgi:cyclopropane fatty-acyl-phospholipid synthase-like methyltransferase
LQGKLLFDPMFPKLAEFVPTTGAVLDIGTGWGVPTTWLAVRHPGLRFVCVEPDEDRALVASWVLAERAEMHIGSAPQTWPQGEYQAVLALDMLHYLSDEELDLFLRRAHQSLSTDGVLVIRVTVPTQKKWPWERTLERWRTRARGIATIFRSEKEFLTSIENHGFMMNSPTPTAMGGRKRGSLAARRARPTDGGAILSLGATIGAGCPWL